MNRKFGLLLFFALILYACAPASPAPNVTVTSKVTVTFTPDAPPTPVKPTATETPTSTPDPNKPPDATGTDRDGNYTMIDKETGETLTWFAIQYGNDAAEGVKGHWFENRMENGKPIFLFDTSLFGFSDMLDNTIPFDQFILTDNKQLQMDYVLRHPNQVNEFGPGTPLNSQSFPVLLHYYLVSRVFGKDHSDLVDADYQKYYDTLNTTASVFVGDDQWVLSKGYREFIVDYGVASKDPSFQKTSEFYWKVMVVDGQLITFIATPEPDKLSDRDMRIMAFAPMWEVILNDPFTPGQTIKSFWGGPGRKAAAEWSQLGGGDNKTYPNVTVQPTTDFLEVDYLE